MTLIIVLAILAVLVVFGIGIYNSLVKKKVRVDEAWSDISVQLKRRYDLIPNLVNTVKGYAKHEQKVFKEVTEARANAIDAQGPKDQAKAEGVFAEALKSLFAVSEAYPDLKADQNFRELQAELVDTEDKIQAARRFYNGSARDLNIAIKMFPNILFAGMLGFTEREFFEVDEDEKDVVAKPVDVSFDDKK